MNNIIVNIANDLYNKWYDCECADSKNYISCKKCNFNLVNWKQGTSWCAAFVSTIIDIANRKYNAGIKLPITASTYQLYMSAKDNYLVDNKPRIGDIFYKSYSASYCNSIGSSNNCGHVGIVVDVNYDNNTITIIDGNSNNKVNKYTTKLSTFVAANNNVPSGTSFIHINTNSNITTNSNYIHNYYL